MDIFLTLIHLKNIYTVILSNIDLIYFYVLLLFFFFIGILISILHTYIIYNVFDNTIN